MAARKNNVLRLLASRKVAHQVFHLPREKLGARATAARLGVPPGQVFKTIVILRTGRGKPILALVSGESEVDLKRLAAAAGEKKLRLATQEEAERLTGLQTGGISPLALLNRGFQVWLDAQALEWKEIHISAGERGLNVRLSPQDLQTLTRARVAEISRPLPLEGE